MDMEQKNTDDHVDDNVINTDYRIPHSVYIWIPIFGLFRIHKLFGISITSSQLLSVYPSDIQDIQATGSGSLEHNSHAHADARYLL